MDIDTKCPNCNKVFPIDDSFVGRRGRCASCRTVFVITSEPVAGIDPKKPLASLDKKLVLSVLLWFFIGIVATYGFGVCYAVAGYMWEQIFPTTETALTILVMVVVPFVYLLPAIVATSRKHPNASAISILTILLGWTFIGWAVAMVWACTATSSTVTHIHKNE